MALTSILSSSLETSFDLTVHDLISIDQINQLIQPGINSANKTELDFLRQRIALSDQKIKLEKSNVDLGFIQPMYTNRNNRERSPGGFAFGVTIPLFNSNRDDVAREKLDQLERQGELEKFQTEEKRKQLTTLAYLQLHFKHYQKMDSLINAFQLRGMNVLTGTSHNYDPVIELKYQEKMIQFEILRTRIKKEILAAYINWLDQADKLQERPLINYLAKDLGQVEE